MGSTNSPSRGKAVTTPNKSKSGTTGGTTGGTTKSGTVKPTGSTNSPGRGK